MSLHGDSHGAAALSPASNPYGGKRVNARGVYVIDCKGGNLSLQLSRIVGTLVVLNPGSVDIFDEVNWEPAVPNYPALLIAGNATIRIDSSDVLDEAANGVNFNPPGSEYEGIADSDNADTGVWLTCW